MKGKENGKSQEYFLNYNMFKIINTNATSLNNKIMEFELYLRCNDWPHVICIAESSQSCRCQTYLSIRCIARIESPFMATVASALM